MGVLNTSCGPYVLVAENDPDDQMLLQLAFAEQERSVQVRYACSGEEVLAILMAGHMPCLLILDYNMPGLNGLEVLQQLAVQPALHALPKVMYSSSANEKVSSTLYGCRRGRLCRKGRGT